MSNLNKVFLMGNLTRDVEMKFTPGGTAVAAFGMAINRKWFDKSTGEQREEVTFVDLEAWGKTAETIHTHLHKGSPLFIEGRLKLDSWEDKTTKQKRSKLKVVVDNFQFIGAKQDAPQAARPQAQASAPEPLGPTPSDDGGVPF